MLACIKSEAYSKAREIFQGKMNARIIIILSCVVLLTSCSDKKVSSLTEISRSFTPSFTPSLTLKPSQTLAVATDTSEITVTKTRRPTKTSTSTQTPSLTPTQTPTLNPISPGRIAYCEGDLLSIAKTDGTDFVSIPNDNPEKLCREVSWSPDGHWIAVTLFEIRAQGWIYTVEDIFLVNVNGNEIQQLTFSPHVDKSGLSWSPNGDYLMFSAEHSNRLGEIYVVNVQDGSEIQNISKTSNYDEYAPVWSPDGSKIAFIRRPDFDSDPTLWVMDANGENQFEVADLEVSWDIAWHPNGEEILFLSGYPCEGVFSVKIDGTEEPKHLFTLRTRIADISYSPDGKHIIFSTGYFDNECASNSYSKETILPYTKIFIVNSDGSSLWQFPTTAKFENASPRWSPVPNMIVGEKYEISESGDLINVRVSPSVKSEQIIQLRSGEIITILDGPIDNDDFYWWKVQLPDGNEGWIVEVSGWYVHYLE